MEVVKNGNLDRETLTASLVGSSGGAWAAINAGLLRPDLVEKVVADSFDGRTLAKNFVQNLINERSGAKQDGQAEFPQQKDIRNNP